MKRWITALAIGLLAISVSAPILAAPGSAKPSATKAKKDRRSAGLKRFEAAIAKLNLTPEQKPKVDAAVKAAVAEGKKIREGAGTPEEKRPKLRQAQQALTTKLMAILTPVQQMQLRDAMEGGKAAPGGKPKKPGVPKE